MALDRSADRSADLWSAVSQASSLPGVGKVPASLRFMRLPTTSRRYSRPEVCATMNGLPVTQAGMPGRTPKASLGLDAEGVPWVGRQRCPSYQPGAKPQVRSEKNSCERQRRGSSTPRSAWGGLGRMRQTVGLQGLSERCSQGSALGWYEGRPWRPSPNSSPFVFSAFSAVKILAFSWEFAALASSVHRWSKTVSLLNP